MKLLTNPIVLRMVLLFFAAGFAFIVGTMTLRRMRLKLAAESSVLEPRPSQDVFPLHTYHAVIQQLKQQKHELISTHQAERRRAKTSENISAAVLSNLSSGVVFFNPNGLVRQVNAAAKYILGISAPVGMNAAELFRDTDLISDKGAPEPLADLIAEGLREKNLSRRATARHITPSGDERILDMTFSSVFTPAASFLGTTCLITDQTELAAIRRENSMRQELSAEMALELRGSLTTMSGYAQQLATTKDPELARQLAMDIAAEAAHLDRKIGGFLITGESARAAASSLTF